MIIMNTAEGREIMEREKHFYLHRSKYELNAKRDQCRELKLVYSKASPEYLRAWAEWMVTAKIYNTVKRLKIGEKECTGY